MVETAILRDTNDGASHRDTMGMYITDMCICSKRANEEEGNMVCGCDGRSAGSKVPKACSGTEARTVCGLP